MNDVKLGWITSTISWAGAAPETEQVIKDSLLP